MLDGEGHSGDVDVTDADVAGLPPGNIRVSGEEFASVWRAAAANDLEPSGDWYAAAVATTCRWLATASARLPNGTAGLLRSPATRREGVP